MSKKKKNQPSPAPICVSQQVDVELTPAEFQLLESVQYLDLEALKQAKHTKIEIGTVEAGCCRKLVFATVQKGMVTALEFEDDGSRTAASAELTKTIEKALEETGSKASAFKALPLPFGDLLLAPGGIFVESWSCFRICIFGFCILCCYGNGRNGPWTICSFS